MGHPSKQHLIYIKHILAKTMFQGWRIIIASTIITTSIIIWQAQIFNKNSGLDTYYIESLFKP